MSDQTIKPTMSNAELADLERAARAGDSAARLRMGYEYFSRAHQAGGKPSHWQAWAKMALAPFTDPALGIQNAALMIGLVIEAEANHEIGKIPVAALGPIVRQSLQQSAERGYQQAFHYFHKAAMTKPRGGYPNQAAATAMLKVADYHLNGRGGTE